MTEMEQREQPNDIKQPFAIMEIVTKSGAMMDVELENADEVAKVEDMIFRASKGQSMEELKILKRAQGDEPEIHTFIKLDADILGYRLYVL